MTYSERWRLVDVSRPIIDEPGQDADLAAVFTLILQRARELTGARYAALGVLNQHRLGLKRFATVGLDRAAHRRIRTLPRGRGVLGLPIEEPRPLRIANLEEHPDRYGFPPDHPEMHSFLGVPIVVGGNAWALSASPRGATAVASPSATRRLCASLPNGRRSPSTTHVHRAREGAGTRLVRRRRGASPVMG